MPQTTKNQNHSLKRRKAVVDSNIFDAEDLEPLPSPPVQKRRRLFEESSSSSSSSTHAAVVAQFNINNFPSILSSSTSDNGSDSYDNKNDNHDAALVSTPKNVASARKEVSLTKKAGGATGKRWRLVPTPKEKNNPPSAATAASVPTSPLGKVQPKGWKSRPEMYKIASQHKGTFIQYKVLHRDAHVADASSKKSRMSLTAANLVVQSRFISQNGSYGGNSYAFMDWKMPGNFLKKKRRQHMTIFQDTRPKLYNPPDEDGKEENANDTAYPRLFFDSELTPDEADMVTEFVQEATPGSTPRDFFYDDLDHLRLPTPARKRRNLESADSEFTTTGKKTGRASNEENPTSPDARNAYVADHSAWLSPAQHELAPYVSSKHDVAWQALSRSSMQALDRTSRIPQPALTAETLSEHQKKWSSNPNYKINTMLNWSNESAPNSFSAPSQVEKHTSASLEHQRRSVSTITRPASTDRGRQTARAGNRDTLSKKLTRSPHLKSPPPFVSESGPTHFAKRRTSSVQKNLERLFAEANKEASIRGSSESTSVHLTAPIHYHDQHETAATDIAVEDGLLSYPNDWNDHFDPFPITSPHAMESLRAFSSLTFNSAPQVTCNIGSKSRFKSRKSGRIAIGTKLWLGLLIFLLCPTVSRYNKGDISVTEWFQELISHSQTWDNPLNLLFRLEGSIIDVISGHKNESKASFSGFKSSFDANRAAHKAQHNALSIVASDSPLLLASTQTSTITSAGSARLEAWPRLCKLCDYATFGLAWFLLFVIQN